MHATVSPDLLAIGDVLRTSLRHQPHFQEKIAACLAALQSNYCDTLSTVANLSNEQLKEIGVEVGHRNILTEVALNLSQRQDSFSSHNGSNNNNTHLAHQHPISVPDQPPLAPGSATTMFLSKPDLHHDDDGPPLSLSQHPSVDHHRRGTTKSTSGTTEFPLSQKSTGGHESMSKGGGHQSTRTSSHGSGGGGSLQRRPSWSSMSASHQASTSIGLPVFAPENHQADYETINPTATSDAAMPQQDAFHDNVSDEGEGSAPLSPKDNTQNHSNQKNQLFPLRPLEIPLQQTQHLWDRSGTDSSYQQTSSKPQSPVTKMTTSTARRFGGGNRALPQQTHQQRGHTYHHHAQLHLAEQRLSVPTFPTNTTEFLPQHNFEPAARTNSVPYDPLTLSARLGAHRPNHRRAQLHNQSVGSYNRSRRLSYNTTNFALSTMMQQHQSPSITVAAPHQPSSDPLTASHNDQKSVHPTTSQLTFTLEPTDEVEWISLCGKRPTLGEFLAEMERIRAAQGFPADFDALFQHQKPGSSPNIRFQAEN